MRVASQARGSITMTGAVETRWFLRDFKYDADLLAADDLDDRRVVARTASAGSVFRDLLRASVGRPARIPTDWRQSQPERRSLVPHKQVCSREEAWIIIAIRSFRPTCNVAQVEVSLPGRLAGK